MMTRILLAFAMLFATPGLVQADYVVCNGNTCRVVRTPVRNTASRVVQWAAPARYSTGSTVVRTYRRGLFGRRVYTGYTTVPMETTSGYGSTGTTTSYGSAGSTTSYAAPQNLQNKAKVSQVEAVSTCDGNCRCPDCPKRAEVQYRLSKTYQLQPRSPDLRLAAR